MDREPPAAEAPEVERVSTATSALARGTQSLVRWFDSWAADERDGQDPRAIDWFRVSPFVAIHVACFAVLLVGWSPFAVAFAVCFYVVRMFAITAFYHRYFSHRSFCTSRVMQFCFALLGATAAQRGPLWWAAHHRAHHRHSDEDADVHSPERQGFWYSHVGWILAQGNFRTRVELVPDLARYPELRFLDRFDSLVPLATMGALFGLGVLLERFAPGLGTNGPQLFVWGFAISTVALYHLTFSINSLAHRVGSRRFETPDQSRNNWLLALFTLGEGWHNNHHRYQASVRQGFRWWEFDPSYYVLRTAALVGLVWDLRPVPERILREGASR
ncbi:MAG: acyl-CoA desaturase [Planctomycetes bacterium]|nr:acyl-CoA desaturase [Planctomycetota bacterium]